MQELQIINEILSAKPNNQTLSSFNKYLNNFYICGNWREVRVYGFFKLLIGGLIPHAPLLMCQKTTKNLDFFRICFCDASLLLKSYDL